MGTVGTVRMVRPLRGTASPAMRENAALRGRLKVPSWPPLGGRIAAFFDRHLRTDA